MHVSDHHAFWIDFKEYGLMYDFLCVVSLLSWGKFFFVALKAAKFELCVLWTVLPPIGRPGGPGETPFGFLVFLF